MKACLSRADQKTEKPKNESINRGSGKDRHGKGKRCRGGPEQFLDRMMMKQMDCDLDEVVLLHAVVVANAPAVEHGAELFDAERRRRHEPRY